MNRKQGIDITGKRYGMLQVLSRADFKKNNQFVWNCVCDCGEQTTVRGYSLRHGDTLSCGCLIKKTATTHGMSKLPIYQIWSGMIDRCNNKKAKLYPFYGGRGIFVSKEWHSFENFFSDMGHRPHDKSMERINNSLGYSKENCKWATRREQANNRRSNILYLWQGENKTLSQLSDISGIAYTNLATRINALGWSLEKAMTTKVNNKKKKSFVGAWNYTMYHMSECKPVPPVEAS